MAKYSVDIPSSIDYDNEWYEVGIFDTREEAIAFVQRHFGADSKGRIDLITRIQISDDDLEDTR